MHCKKNMGVIYNVSLCIKDPRTFNIHKRTSYDQSWYETHMLTIIWHSVDLIAFDLG